MQPVFFFKIFGVPLFSYTTCTLVGVVAALLAAHSQARRLGADSRGMAAALVFVAVPALIAGRTVHWLLTADYYLERPTQLLKLDNGGMSAVGVWIGAVGGLWLWSRRQHISLAQSADASALPAALVACGAWLGAFMRGSQFGAPADNWLALELQDVYGVVDLRWATQLFAATWCALIGLALVLAQWRGRGSAKCNSAVFLGLYGGGLLIIDATRGDTALYILGLRTTQWLYLVMILTALTTIGRRLGPRLTGPQKPTKI